MLFARRLDPLRTPESHRMILCPAAPSDTLPHSSALQCRCLHAVLKSSQDSSAEDVMHSAHSVLSTFSRVDTPEFDTAAAALQL